MEQNNNTNEEQECIIEVIPNGPLRVYGNLSVKKADGTIEKRTKAASFCRCGASANKPFCDGTHKGLDFVG
ncbi:MAG TPA: CDGSH iron-sulfur domain-containing protein [Saprospiraceae bacterium]|nr:CDGSH iron-sulfur domain-containing protein [Saprospiraceae bacterium]HMQ81731.1 CDGSH iron-sulfur domain-containing protein [Saprospiraceae bacterium]